MARYTPEPVPDIQDNVQELRRYLDQELNRISESVNQKVDRAYGGIFQTVSPKIISPLDLNFVLFDTFDIVTPARPDGVEGFPALGSLVVLSGGAYEFSFSTSIGNIPPNAEYALLLAKNGVSTGLGGTVEPSNQTDNVTVAFTILSNAQKGDVYTMLINSVTNTDAEITGSEFGTSRVSEEQ